MAASVAIGVAALVRGVVLVQSARTYDSIGRSVGGAEGIERIKTAIISVLLATALVAVAGIVVLVWLFVARTNADHVPGPSPRWARGWSIGAWFVPIGNLVLVPLVVTDVWRSSGPDRRGPVEVALWWTSVLLAAVLNLAATSYRQGGDPASATGLQILGAVLEVVAGGLLILVVTDVWRSSGPDRRGPVEVALWWTSVLLAAVLNLTATSYRVGGDPATATGLQILGAVLEVVAGGMLILVVHRISTWQGESRSTTAIAR